MWSEIKRIAGERWVWAAIWCVGLGVFVRLDTQDAPVGVAVRTLPMLLGTFSILLTRPHGGEKFRWRALAGRAALLACIVALSQLAATSVAGAPTPSIAELTGRGALNFLLFAALGLSSNGRASMVTFVALILIQQTPDWSFARAWQGPWGSYFTWLPVFAIPFLVWFERRYVPRLSGRGKAVTIASGIAFLIVCRYVFPFAPGARIALFSGRYTQNIALDVEADIERPGSFILHYPASTPLVPLLLKEEAAVTISTDDGRRATVHPTILLTSAGQGNRHRLFVQYPAEMAANRWARVSGTLYLGAFEQGSSELFHSRPPFPGPDLIELRGQSQDLRFRPDLMFALAPGFSAFARFQTQAGGNAKDYSVVVWRRIGRYRADFSLETSLWPINSAIR